MSRLKRLFHVFPVVLPSEISIQDNVLCPNEVIRLCAIMSVYNNKKHDWSQKTVLSELK